MTRAVFLIFAIALAGCAVGPTYERAQRSQYTETNYRSADKIATILREQKQAGPLLVATFVAVDNLQRTSKLGRSLSEQIGSRLAQAGYSVVGLRLRDSIFVSTANQGEFPLSGEVKEISVSQNAFVVVTGTYADAGEYVYVAVKVIDLKTNRVIASDDYTLPGVDTIRAMLTNKTR